MACQSNESVNTSTDEKQQEKGVYVKLNHSIIEWSDTMYDSVGNKALVEYGLKPVLGGFLTIQADSSYEWKREQYIELTLYGAYNDSLYAYKSTGKKELKESPLTLELTGMEIVGHDKERMYFETPASFLNYMDSCGYKMSENTKHGDGIDYLFVLKE
jgi:hypothetical protein